MDIQMYSAGCTTDETTPGSSRKTRGVMCLETTVSEIRSSSGWIQRLVRERRRSEMQQSASQSLSFATAKDSLRDSRSNLSSTPSLVGSQPSTQPETENMLLILPSPQSDIPARGVTEADPFKSLSGLEIEKPPGQQSLEWQMPATQHPSGEPQSLVLRLAKLFLLAIAQAGLALFLMAMCRIVSKVGNAGLAYHQILQTTVLASSTQAVIILQHSQWPALPDSKRTARTAHIILQGVAGTACLAALVDGAMRSGDRGADQFWNAPHVRANIAAMAMFILQAVFGISMVFATRLFGGQRKAKHSYKYHRICGYATLTAMWTTGALGVHAVLQQEGAQALNSRYEWHAVPRGTWAAAGAMLALGVVFGIDIRKIGLHRSAQVKKGTFARAWP